MATFTSVKFKDSKLRVAKAFVRSVNDELTVEEGAIVVPLYQEDDWVFVRDPNGKQGFIPASICHLEPSDSVNEGEERARKGSRKQGSSSYKQKQNVSGERNTGFFRRRMSAMIRGRSKSTEAVSRTSLPPTVSGQNSGNGGLQQNATNRSLESLNAIHNQDKVQGGLQRSGSVGIENVTRFLHQLDTDSNERPVDVPAYLRHHRVASPNQKSPRGKTTTSGRPASHHATAYSQVNVNGHHESIDQPAFNPAVVAGELASQNVATSRPLPQPDNLFIAMYNFQAQFENDLSITKGDLIRLINSSDPDWSWVVTEGGEQGFVPRCFLVGPLMPQDFPELFPEQNGYNVTASHSQSPQQQGFARKHSDNTCIAVGNYSPQAPDDLTLEEGDIIDLRQTLPDRPDSSDFVWGYSQRLGKYGYVPASFLSIRGP